MAKLADIKAPIREEMQRFEPKFKMHLSSKVPLVDRVMGYMVKRKGKQMRPILVFLSAKLLGDVNESTYRGASLIELMHTATLVHDDVVDDSDMRRGFFKSTTQNAVYRLEIRNIPIGLKYCAARKRCVQKKAPRKGALNQYSSSFQRKSSSDG